MKMKKVRLVLSMIGVVALSGCGTSNMMSMVDEQGTELSKLPEWVFNPQYNGRIAGSACVPAGDSIGYSMIAAEADATNNLAKHLELQVNLLLRRAVSITDISGGKNIGAVTKESGKQVIKDMRISPQRVDGGVYNSGSRREVCVLMTLSENETLNLFRHAMKKVEQMTGKALPADDKRILLEEAKSGKMFEELDNEIRQD